MFILRKITGNGGELNFALGDSYSLILKDKNPKEFNEVLSVGGHSAFEDDLYGFITYGDCQHQMLFIKQFNYIMTDSGKTFKNITSYEKMLNKAKESAESDKHFDRIKRIHRQLEGEPLPPVNYYKETNLSEHFSKCVCQNLKKTLNIETVEEANKYSDEDLLKVNMFGLMALQKLRRLKP
jgi:hypothetical protein